MKKIAIVLLLLIVAPILAGCQGKVSGRLDGLLNDVQPQDSTATPAMSAIQPTANTSSRQVAGGKAAVTYYPDSGLPVAASNSPVVLTDKLKMKLYLAEKYKPGICFGEPAGLMSDTVLSYLKENSALAAFVKDYYKISNDLEIYSKIRQIEGISLTRGTEGKYLYRFTDGECCDLTTYEGEINIINVDIFENLLSHNTKKIPC